MKAVIAAFLFFAAGVHAESGFETSSNALAFSVYNALKKDPGTFFFSPSSLAGSLAALYTGADGQTAAQIKTALHTPLSQEAIAPAFSAWRGAWAANTGKSRLTVATGVFPRAGVPFRPSAIRLLKEQFAADVIPIDYAFPTKAQNTLSAWVARRTDNRITGVGEPPARDVMLTIIDAVYFNSRWEHPFPSAATQNRSFFITPDQSIRGAFMSVTATFHTSASAGVNLIELPYAQSPYAMLIALPADPSAGAFAKMEASLSVETFSAWRESLKPESLTLWLPRFLLKRSFSADSALRELGMADAFTPSKADFSRFDRSRMLYLSRLEQQIYLDVNEGGTVAAAVTRAESAGFGPPALPPVFNVNRPFLFFVIEKRSGCILFMGRITDPRNRKETV